MKTMSKYAKVLIGLVVVALLAGVLAISVASADTPTPTPQAGQNTFYSNFINKLASALGKTPQDVQTAVTKAEKDMVSEALQQGKITQQQADAANKRIDNGGFGFMLNRFGGKRPGPAAGMWFGMGSNTVANFLGMQPADLVKELRSGKSLAQVAQEHGKTRDDLKAAITSNTKNRLDQAVANGKLTQDQENTALSKLQSNLDKMIDRTFQPRANGAARGNWRNGHRPNNSQPNNNQPQS